MDASQKGKLIYKLAELIERDIDYLAVRDAVVVNLSFSDFKWLPCYWLLQSLEGSLSVNTWCIMLKNDQTETLFGRFSTLFMRVLKGRMLKTLH